MQKIPKIFKNKNLLKCVKTNKKHKIENYKKQPKFVKMVGINLGNN